MSEKRTLLLEWSTLAILYAGASHAQTASVVQDKPPGGLEEIIVTAEKRAENVQDVPIAMAAISGDSLQGARVLDTKALQSVVPTLHYGNGGGFATPFLRGIGSSVQQPGAEPSVATFIDGVYVASNQGTILSLLGVDRVEVLSGPQGTLYGRNASGGAINVYTLTPSQDFEAKITGTVGNYAAAEMSGYVSGAVSDTLSVGVYAGYSRRDSYLNFGPTPGQEDETNGWGARLKAVWEPTEGVKLTGSVEKLEHQNVEIAFRNVQPNALGVTLGGNPTIAEYRVFSDVPQRSKPTTTAAVLREEFDLDFADLVGITGYRDLETDTRANIDGTDSGLVDVYAPIFSRQFSQEIQLLSKPDSRIQWIAGLFYFDEHGGYGGLNIHSDILFAGLPFNTATTSGDENTTSYAAFAQVTVPITDMFNVTLGGRYTKDEKEKPSQVSSVSFNGAPVGIPETVTPGAEESWSDFSPKITLEYSLDDALLYATYAEGFKSGQFNTSSAADLVPVDPEDLTDYEVGVKSDLFDRRLRLNLAAYYYDFQNLQVQVLDPSGGGVAAVVRNAAKAEAYGLEVTAIAAVTDNFTLNVAAAYEHSEYKEFDNAPFVIFSPTGNSQVLGFSAAGNELIRAPEFVGTLGGTYSIPLAGSGMIELHADAYYNGGYFWDPAQQFEEDAYTLVNASVKYTAPSGKWTVQAWGTNITDEHHFGEIAAAVPFGTYASDAEPAMYGLTLTWKM